MKKPIMIFASLALGTMAFAQDAAPGGSAPTPATPPMSSAPSSDTAAPTDAGTPAPAPAAPDASAPAATDASAPTPPSDSSTAAAPSAGASATDTSNYPRCSRGVTDKCVQGGTAKKAVHHRRKH